MHVLPHQHIYYVGSIFKCPNSQNLAIKPVIVYIFVLKGISKLNIVLKIQCKTKITTVLLVGKTNLKYFILH